MINSLDLFSGIGGISLALKDYVRPIAFCEIDKYCQKVLSKNFPNIPIYDDVATLGGEQFNGKIDIIYGGFPCQDISVAGLGKGLEGERSGLFYQIVRLTKEIQPSFVFLENVPAIRRRGLFTVVSEFTELGYDCRWTIVSAREVGAPHLRKRWFLLAHASREGLERQGHRTKLRQEKLAESSTQNEVYKWGVHNSWLSEPNVDRMADGIPFRVDRVKALGNSVVPLTVKTAFERLMGLK